jgi:hypothetical protein
MRLQEIRHFCLICHKSLVKGSIEPVVDLTEFDILALEEQFDDFARSLCDSKMQRCIQVLVQRIHIDVSFSQDQFDCGDEPAVAREVKWRPMKRKKTPLTD